MINKKKMISKGVSLMESFNFSNNHFATSKEIDKEYNPNCYGNYNASSSDIGPIMSSDIVLCTGADKIPLHSLEQEFFQDNTDIKISISKISEADPIKNPESESSTIDLLVIPRQHINIEIKKDSVLIFVNNDNSIQRISVNRKSGWHGIDFRTGLPIIDGKNHNGYSGLDRYLWIRDTTVPWIAAPIHFSHIPNAPYMNIALFFHLSVRFSYLD